MRKLNENKKCRCKELTLLISWIILIKLYIL